MSVLEYTSAIATENTVAQPATPSLEEVIGAIDRAWDTVSALCDGRLRWEMRVPAEPDHDPDLIIGEALRLARAYIKATTS